MRIKSILFIVIILVLVVNSVNAAVQITGVNSTDPTAYAGDISATDFANGQGVSIWNNWQPALPVAGLTDGPSGTISWALDPYDNGAGAMIPADWHWTLNTVSSPDGYDITGIQSISSWAEAFGWSNQAYTVFYTTVDAPAAWTVLVTVNYQPFTATQAGATKVNITDDAGGVLLSRVDKIWIHFAATTSSQPGTIYDEIDIFAIPTIDDIDGDGLPDSYEEAHTNPPSATAMDANEDFEPDGLTNLQEYQIGTDPNDADTDDDTLEDGAEVAGAGLRPATNPLLADTDADGLDDNIETNTGTFVNASDTGTNPTLADTDNDGFKDGAEVDAGTDPTNTNDHPVVEHYHVFLLGGQSNMVGTGVTSDLPAELQNPQDDVLFYYGNTLLNNNLTLTTLRPGTGGATSAFGPEVTFGRSLADSVPVEKFVLIKYAASGTNLYEEWSPTLPGVQYVGFRNTVDAGLAALQAQGDTYQIDGMLWLQGESDAVLGQQNNYQANLTNFIADMRSNYGTNLPFLIVEIGTEFPGWESQLATVVAAQKAISAADPYASLVPTDDLKLWDSDHIHFDTDSLISIGQRAGQIYVDNFFVQTYPSVDAGSDMISWSGAAAQLGPNVVNNSLDVPQAELTFHWSASPDAGVVFDPGEFAEAPTVKITNPATANPSVITLTLAVNNVGSTNSDVEDSLTIDLYDTACDGTIAAGQGGSSDLDGNCQTNLQDLAIMAANWLSDISAKGSVPKQ